MDDAHVNTFETLRKRHGGAARLSVFFALWTLALVVFHDVRVNAAPVYDVAVRSDAAWRIVPVPPPNVASEAMWDALSQRSDVISGRWQAVGRASSVRNSSVAKGSAKSTNERKAARAEVSQKAATEKAFDQAPVVKRSSSLSESEVEIGRRVAVRDFEGAIEALAQARAENPNSGHRLRLLDARIAIGQGELERAYSTLLESLPDVRVSTQQHDLLAAVMLRTSRYAEAAAVYRALLSVDPANVRWWAGYAVTQEKLDHRTELISAYRTLRSLAPPGTTLAAWASERLERIG